MSDISSVVLTSQIVNITVGLIGLFMAWRVLALLDKANGSDFKVQLELIKGGNLAVAAYEAVKFFTVGFVIAMLLK